MSEQQPKDVMIKTKGVDVRKNSKGGDFITLRLSREEAESLLAVSAESLTDNGLRLDIHISEKETKDGSRSFLSAIMFSKGIQERPAAGGGMPSKPVAQAQERKSQASDLVNSLRSSKRSL